jgi:aryl-phospho-beta-D-glucosidase BglC (GH1 family)
MHPIVNMKSPVIASEIINEPNEIKINRLVPKKKSADASTTARAISKSFLKQQAVIRIKRSPKNRKIPPLMKYT